MKLLSLSAVPIVLCMCVALSAHPQNDGVPQDKGAITGTVVDAISEQPLRGAEVRLRGLPGVSASVSRSTSASTDANGRFVFEGLSAGRYFLVASHDGYANNNRDRPWRRGTALSLAPGQHVNDIVLRLLPDGVIAGHITNEAGKPLRGVSVQAMKSSYPRGRRELHDVAHVTASEAGEYRITGLAPGKYYIRARALGAAKAKRLSDKAYVPLYYPAVSDQSRAVALVVRAGEDLAGIDMNFIPVHTVHVRGRVINAHTGLPSKEAEVTLLSDEGGTVFSPSQNLSGGPQASFEFRGVPPGSYVLVAQQPSNPHERKTTWGRTAIEVGDTNIEHADVVVGPGVDVSGRIRLDGQTATDVSKEDISKDLSSMVGVLESDEPSSLANLTPDIDNASAKSDGTFVFREVPEGSYRIDFFPVPAGYYLKSSSAANVLETGIIVGRGHSPPALELVLSAGAARIDGIAKNGEQSLRGTSVVLVPDGKQRSQLNSYREVFTDQLGRFVMRNIPPGDYELFAWEHIEVNAYFDPEFLGQYEDRGKAVHVEEGDRLNLELDVIPGAETP